MSEQPIVRGVAAMSSVVVMLPLRIVSEANARDGWRAKARRAREQRALAYMYLSSKVRTLPLPAAITITRIAPRRMDSDNLASACKAVRDGVADALGLNDGDERLVWRYSQRPWSLEQDFGRPCTASVLQRGRRDLFAVEVRLQSVSRSVCRRLRIQLGGL